MKSLEGCRVLQILALSLIVGLLDLAAVTSSYAESTDLPPTCEQTCSSSSDCTDFCYSSCEVNIDEGTITDVTCQYSTCGESATCGSCDDFCSQEANCGQSCTDTNGFTQLCPECSGGGDDDSEDDNSRSSGGYPSYEELLSGRVWQTSTAWGGEARRAVDGNPDGNYGAGSVTHTDINVRPEWHIETQHTLYKSVTIYNRTDCCGERLAGASVWVHNWDPKSGTYIWRHVFTIPKTVGSSWRGGPPPKIHISFYGKLPNGYANALAITLPPGSKVPLSLAEVQLWGCGGPGHRCWE